MAATDSTTQLSPKVRAIDKVAGLGVIGIGAVAVMLGLVTPDLFPALGPWAPIIAAGAVYVGARLAAYQARDPLRENYTAQQNAFESQRAQELDPTPVPQGYQDQHVEAQAVENWPENKG
jgi:hypothetical protein